MYAADARRAAARSRHRSSSAPRAAPASTSLSSSRIARVSRAAAQPRAYAGERRAVQIEAVARSRRRGSCTSRARHRGRDRRHAAAERLAKHEHVGHEPVALEGEQRAGPAEAGLHLVEDEERAVPPAQLLRLGEVAGRQPADAGLRLDRLDDERGERRVASARARAATSPNGTWSHPAAAARTARAGVRAPINDERAEPEPWKPPSQESDAGAAGGGPRQLHCRPRPPRRRWWRRARPRAARAAGRRAPRHSAAAWADGAV